VFKLFIVVLSCFVSSSCAQAAPANARCTAELLGGDTVNFTVNSNVILPEGVRRRPDNFDAATAARQARDAIEYYTRLHTSFGLVCDIHRDLGIRPDPNGCRRIKPYAPASEVCYLESNIGYFISHLDLFGQFNVTFVRWD
jgi:hypothetical protein